MRTVSTLLIGVVIGVAVTLATMQVAGGWYTYATQPRQECERDPLRGEVVPNQPNPCHFRFPRWGFQP